MFFVSIHFSHFVCFISSCLVWFEPTDPSLASKIFSPHSINLDNFEAIKFISPNFAELQVIYRDVFGNDQFDHHTTQQTIQNSKNFTKYFIFY